MAGYTRDYKQLLQQGIRVCEALGELYAADAKTRGDWANRSLSDTQDQRASFGFALVNTWDLAARSTTTLVGCLARYLDNHWADYTDLPVADPEKRLVLERLRAEL